MSAAVKVMPRRRWRRWLTILLFAFPEMAFTSNHVSFLMFLGHCIRGDIDAIRIILKDNPEYAFELSTEGESCLHLASVYGHADITRLLLHGDSQEPPHVRENNSNCRRGREYGGHADTMDLTVELEDDPKELSRSSQEPNIGAIVADIHEEWLHKDNFEKFRTMPLQQRENRADEL